MRQHFVLCGLGKVGARVLEYLRKAGETVTVINTGKLDDESMAGVKLICGDCRLKDVLQQADLDHARAVLVLTSDDLVNLSAALMVRHLHPNVRIIVRMFNQNLINRLGSATTNIQALSASALASPLLAMIARTGQALGMFRLKSGADRQITELTLTPQSPLVGRRLAELARTSLHRGRPCSGRAIAALHPGGGCERDHRPRRSPHRVRGAGGGGVPVRAGR